MPSVSLVWTLSCWIWLQITPQYIPLLLPSSSSSYAFSFLGLNAFLLNLTANYATIHTIIITIFRHHRMPSVSSVWMLSCWIWLAPWLHTAEISIFHSWLAPHSKWDKNFYWGNVVWHTNSFSNTMCLWNTMPRPQQSQKNLFLE